MGEFTRLADLLLTNDLDTALRLLDRRTNIGGGGGFLGLGIWRYRTETDSSPDAGQLQFDDTTIGDATELYVHAINDSGADMSAFLDLLSAFDLMYIQVQVDASQFVTLQIGTPSLAASVYTFPISQIQGQGTTPSNNTEVAVVIERSGGGAGVTDHGALTGLLDDDHKNYLHKDITRHLTVGYTTDVEADVFDTSLTPDFQLEYFKTMTVTDSFTLNTPTGNSHGEYYLTIDSGGPYTLTAGTNVTMVDSNVTMLADENYVLNIHRYSATNTLAQLTLPGDTSGEKWNAHGNAATGGGDFSLDANLDIPTGSAYQINSLDVVSMDSTTEINLGSGNTTGAGAGGVANTNVAQGYGNIAGAGRRRVAMGSGNESLSNNDLTVGVLNIAGTNADSNNTAMGRGNTVDGSGIGVGKDNTVDAGIAIGLNCTAAGTAIGSTPAFAMGVNCSATGSNCASLGIAVTNTIAQSFKIGPNDATAILISGNGLGVALGGQASARVHIGQGSATVPSIILQESTQLITSPKAGAIEYAPQVALSDPYIFFTHEDGTRSNMVTIHATNIDDTDSSYTILIKDSVIICDTTNGSVEVLLPTAASAKDRMLNIKRKPGSAGVNVVTINPAGSENIEGSSLSFILGVAGANAQIISDGTEWWVV